MQKEKKDKKYKRSYARRLTRGVMLVLFVMMSGMGYLIYHLSKDIVVDFMANVFHTNMQASARYISNAMEDVSSAVRNNIYDVEHNLHDSEQLHSTFKRIEALNPRVRNCDILAVAAHQDEEWFHEAVAGDSACWPKPYFDDNDAKTPVVAYLHPIRDGEGQLIAFLRATLSLEFMTQQQQQQDSIFQANAKFFAVSSDGSVFHSYVLMRDGTFLTHSEHRRILKGNFFDHVKDADDAGVASKVIGQMKKGERSKDETDEVLLVNRAKTYLFYAPIEGSDWMLAVSVPTMALDLFGVIVGILMLLIIVFVLIVTFFACHIAIQRAVKPLMQLAGAADEVAGGHFDATLPAIKSRDEIHLLRDSFENMQHSLTAYIEELKSATASKASMESELKIAHDIQMSMLPKTYPAFPDRNDLDIYGFMMPAKAVGGDLYDFFIRDEKLFFCIGDVSGKGVPASLLMTVTRFLFRNIASYTPEPDHIIQALNEALSRNNDTGIFVTLFLGALDLKTGLLSYSNAGHNPPLLLSGGEVSIVPCDSNIPVGVVSGWEFTAQQLQLASGDTVFLYTDGLNEAEDNIHQQFGIDRMLTVANASSHQPQPLIEAMIASVQQFIGNAEQSDDLTMLTVQYTNPD